MTISNVSSGLRPGVCTSSTRPSAPYEGQMIYETDTDMVAIWNGSAWRYVAATTPTNGTVLQVQSSVYTTQILAGTSYGDTGLSASITPKSSSSKVLVTVSAAYYNSAGKGSIRILRDATQIAETNQMGADSQNPSSYLSLMYLDSPSTTSSLTYKVQAKTDSGGFYFAHNSRTNTLTLMEIAG